MFTSWEDLTPNMQTDGGCVCGDGVGSIFTSIDQWNCVAVPSLRMFLAISAVVWTGKTTEAWR
jgi:hypothetical protein